MKRNNITRLTHIAVLLLTLLFTGNIIVSSQPPLRRSGSSILAGDDSEQKPNSATTTIRSSQRSASKSANAKSAPKKKVQSSPAAAPTADRASLMFPTSVDVPDDVNWKRDVYRNLDLTQDANAPLYFPVEPTDGKVNLFTLLFKLFSEGKIPVYNVPIETGIEDFRSSNRAHFKDFLENNMIDYEVQGNRLIVSDADLAAVSENVLQIKIKESSYYDQNTATFHSRVVALCPVLCRTHSFDFGDVDETAEEMMSDDEGSEDESEDTGEPTMANEPVSDTRRAPLFWVKIEDVAPYLAKSMIMLSNYNNAASCSMLDFFDTNKYKGSIFMTTNMQNRILVNDVKDPKKLKETQNKIEKELVDFEKHIWANPADSIAQAKRDSIAAAQNTKKISKSRSSASRIAAREESASSKREKKSKSSSADKPEKAAKAPKASSGPRVSARRQRH